MMSRTSFALRTVAIGQSTTEPARRTALLWLLAVSGWSGLVGGLLEVTAIVVRKRLVDSDQIYRTSRHYIWLIPLSNLAIALLLGFIGCTIVLIWPRRGRWLHLRFSAVMVLLPSLLVADPRIYTLAWLVVAMGLAARLVPLCEQAGQRFRRLVVFTFPTAIAVVAALAASLSLADFIAQRHESTRALPRPGSTNVLLVVLDTVAAGHLSVYGYGRGTSTTISELSQRAILFESARAASSWTLPSHASMFTGRWPHELSTGWFTPLDKTHPTLAEFLGDRGYATAGFVANTAYCGAGTGLNRGFTRYDDHIFPELTVLKTAALVDRTLELLRAAVYFSEDWLESNGLLSSVRRVERALDDDRKRAADVRAQLLAWLGRRDQPDRPFFAFLNFYDAHYPYRLPPGRLHRFGVEPADYHERYLIGQWGLLDKKTVSTKGVEFAVAAYDDCVADLDEQLGKLVDELSRRRLLDHTWLIVTADHGESFGEHPDCFCHGTSLYDTELHVPLLVIPPGGNARAQVVDEPVSLRDFAATIVDITGQAAGSPFPGASLAQLWKQPKSGQLPRGSISPSLAEVVPSGPYPGADAGNGRQLAPIAALKGRIWSYAHRAADGREKLYRLTEDPREERDLADDPSLREIRSRLHSELNSLTGGPLLPPRFAR